jgi:hypothetical protein
MTSRWVVLLMLGALACDQVPEQRSERFDAASGQGNELALECEMPVRTRSLLERDGLILEAWELPFAEILTQTELLPDEPAFLAYRAAIEQDGANVLHPVADPLIIRTEAEAELFRNEDFNNDLIFNGVVGSIDPITCLDALLFSRQASRHSQIEQPTEFLAHVLRREAAAGPDLVVVFGAGSEMFPPREVYGFEVVDSILAEGWSYWYAIHNHTVQKNGDLLALGVPAPSASDVGLYRSLAEEMGLQSFRVTNGFYTFSASTDELGAFRAR